MPAVSVDLSTDSLTPAVASAVTDPDTLYALAFSSVHADTSAFNDLTSGVRGIVTTGEKIVSMTIGADGAAELGKAVIAEVGTVIGTDTMQAMQGLVAEVVNAVADYLPLIGAAVGGVFGIIMGQLNADAAKHAAYEAASSAVLARQIPLSGVANTFQPADLFSYDAQWEIATGNAALVPSNPTNPSGYPYCPYSPLGLMLAAVTEDGDNDGGWQAIDPTWDGRATDGSVGDNNLHHPSAALGALYQAWPQGLVRKAGLAPARRRVYQTLRKAMGSRNSDQGSALWPVYLDMLVADFDRGALTRPFVVYLLTSYYDGKKIHDVADSGEYNTLGGHEFFLTQEIADTFAKQIQALVDAWKKQRKVPLDFTRLPHLTLTPSKGSTMFDAVKEKAQEAVEVVYKDGAVTKVGKGLGIAAGILVVLKVLAGRK